MSLEEPTKYLTKSEIDELKRKVLGEYHGKGKRYSEQDTIELFEGTGIPSEIISREFSRFVERNNHELERKKTKKSLKLAVMSHEEIEKVVGEKYAIGKEGFDCSPTNNRAIIAAYRIRTCFFKRHCGRRMTKINPLVDEITPLSIKIKRCTTNETLLYCLMCGTMETIDYSGI